MIKAPFPYYGGKSRIAEEVWTRFGKVDRYLEPFAGSLAVLLYKDKVDCFEVVCDLNGYIANFWRAVTHDPEQTAQYACYPTIHQDLSARQKHIYKWLQEYKYRLSDDAEFYDCKIAGWWVWGMSSWIGLNYGVPQLTGTKGEKRPAIKEHDGGDGVQAQRKSMPNVSHVKTQYGGKGVAPNQERFYDVRPDVKNRSGIAPNQAKFAEKMPHVNIKNKGQGSGVSAQKDGLRKKSEFSDVVPHLKPNTKGGSRGVAPASKEFSDKRPHMEPQGGGNGVQAQGHSFHEKRPRIFPGTGGGGGVQPSSQEVSGDKRPQINNKDAGRGVSVQKSSFSDGIPQMEAGQGVQSQRKSFDDDENDPITCYMDNVLVWFRALQNRLLRVTVLNRDWKSCITPTVLGNTKHTHAETALFLDPPYLTSGRSNDLYQSDKDGISDDVARECFEWSVANGERYRIAYCSTKGQFDLPDGWTEVLQTYGGIRDEEKRDKVDCIMFSPRCGGERDLFDE